jgi:hypothetical protein
MKEGEKSKNLAWPIVSIVGVVTVVVVLCIVLMNRGDLIKTIAQFKEAFADKRALNCKITSPTGETLLVQTSEGFDKIKLVIENSTATTGGQFMLKADDKFYLWDEDVTMAFLTTSSDTLDEITAEIGIIEEGDGHTLNKCEFPDKANFEIPDNIDFIDLDAQFNSFYDDDYYYDEDGYDFSE